MVRNTTFQAPSNCGFLPRTVTHSGYDRLDLPLGMTKSRQWPKPHYNE